MKFTTKIAKITTKIAISHIIWNVENHYIKLPYKESVHVGGARVSYISLSLRFDDHFEQNLDQLDKL
jgi:hypothetical protein